ncbi:UNVERIFIED_CONTAM: hypothetical protein Sindi_1324100 [Sesamum indicum]
MVMYLLATLLHSFKGQLLEGETVDISEKFGIVMRKKTPLFAILYRSCQRKMDGLAVVALTVISVLASIFWCTWKFKKSNEGIVPYPPGPRGLLVLG